MILAGFLFITCYSGRRRTQPQLTVCDHAKLTDKYEIKATGRTDYRILLALLLFYYASFLHAATLHVGPQHFIKSIASAAKQAQDGDTIEVEAGDYEADVAIWTQNRLTVRGIGQRPRLIAKGAAAEGKAIWVVRGGDITIDNFEFTGAKVGDKNGAGIRLEQGRLSVRNSRFTGNENGILATSGDISLSIENCEFDNNGAGDGFSHNLYVGEIRRLRVTGSYFHHANVGHLLKSRAAENHILYNRLTDEINGRASYELEFPNGGIAYVVGNIIEQSVTTKNDTLISYGAEGYKYQANKLYLINNTLIDRKSASVWPWNRGGTFLDVRPGVQSVKALNNLLIGKRALESNAEGVFVNNINVNEDIFVAPETYDLRIKAKKATDYTFETPLGEKGVIISPTREYLHLASSQPLKDSPGLPGARQTQANDASSDVSRTHTYAIPTEPSWLDVLLNDYMQRTPGEILRYAEKRLYGHTRLEMVFLPVINFLRPYIERPVTGPFPTLGKGQQEQSLPPQRYDTEGRPIPAKLVGASVPTAQPNGERKLLSSMEEIMAAITTAQAGDILEILPGTYAMPRSIRVHRGGQLNHPIMVRASRPGSVIFESGASEGFHLHAPWWIFENLTIRGVCKEHSNCDHAFHIVGKARNIVIRNNRLEDFNAQIKVNGLDGDWPDDGLVQYNTLTNSGKRITGNSVTPVDVVGASRWVVADNFISNFIKAYGNEVSYGVFMKGGGSEGRVERNLVICTTENISQAGKRLGLSLGGGGTDKGSCRDQRCITEHSKGTIADNVIAHCNDFGIYINSANQSTVNGNTLVNTYGIDVRFATSSAVIKINELDGTIRARDGAAIDLYDNRRHWALGLPSKW